MIHPPWWYSPTSLWPNHAPISARSSLLIKLSFWKVISYWLQSHQLPLLNMNPPNSGINVSDILPPYHSCLSPCFSWLHPLSFSFQRPLFPWEEGWEESGYRKHSLFCSNCCNVVPRLSGRTAKTLVGKTLTISPCTWRTCCRESCHLDPE